MSSALKQREDNTNVQMVINESMNMAVVSEDVNGEEKAIEQNIRLETIYEKTFEDTIIDAIFDTTTVSIEEAKRMGWKTYLLNEEDKMENKALISYPKALIVKDKESPGKKTIKFLNKNGEETQTIQIKKEKNGDGG